MVLSAEPVTNHSFDGSKAIDLTQPKWPETTALNSQGACHSGVGTTTGWRVMRALDILGPDPLWGVAILCIVSLFSTPGSARAWLDRSEPSVRSLIGTFSCCAVNPAKIVTWYWNEFHNAYRKQCLSCHSSLILLFSLKMNWWYVSKSLKNKIYIPLIVCRWNIRIWILKQHSSSSYNLIQNHWLHLTTINTINQQMSSNEVGRYSSKLWQCNHISYNLPGQKNTEN